MWGWIFVFIAFVLFLYVYFLKRELQKLRQEVKELPERSSFGTRLSLDFRDKALLDLIDGLNQMIDAFDGKSRQAKQMEENVKLTIAGLSHDLRTPLTSINGYVQLLQVTTDETKRQHYISIIKQSVDRLMKMTDHFYELARIETDQKEIVFSSIALSNLVEEVVLSFYDQLQEKQIELHFPEHQQHNYQIIADEFLLIRVIQNVIQNIIRYAKSRAIISYDKQGENILFTIKNDIKTDSKIAVEKVFTRFYTEVASRTNTEASGLGLYLSKKLVGKMNGKMDAALHGEWFILTVRLPVNRSQF
ncbi:HAMP domain-containing sensor histidine kinase [Oceanobacillus sp. FSL K6-2867]|uniref:sensor histidine kinase n=1 Tax=Oceanobacillus sp. FSL K6-2867 TaxID=2954748 RepID=UPI0030D9CEEE